MKKILALIIMLMLQLGIVIVLFEIVQTPVEPEPVMKHKIYQPSTPPTLQMSQKTFYVDE